MWFFMFANDSKTYKDSHYQFCYKVALLKLGIKSIPRYVDFDSKVLYILGLAKTAQWKPKLTSEGTGLNQPNLSISASH